MNVRLKILGFPIIAGDLVYREIGLEPIKSVIESKHVSVFDNYYY